MLYDVLAKRSLLAVELVCVCDEQVALQWSAGVVALWEPAWALHAVGGRPIEQRELLLEGGYLGAQLADLADQARDSLLVCLLLRCVLELHLSVVLLCYEESLGERRRSYGDRLRHVWLAGKKAIAKELFLLSPDHMSVLSALTSLTGFGADSASAVPVDDLSGPAENEIGLSSTAKYMKPQLIFLREEHMRYQLSELSHFHRYVIYKYTLQSWQVNEHLAGISSAKSVSAELTKANKIIFVRDFFYNYNHPVYGDKNIGNTFQAYKRYFRRPEEFLPQQVSPPNVETYLDDRAVTAARQGLVYPDFHATYQIALKVMQTYIVMLEMIIRNAPRNAKSFRVYKGSTAYPGVPKDRPLPGPVNVSQPLFNSTSYDPSFNYGAFIAEEDHWLLWSLEVPPNTPCLIISDLNHALPFEQEVLFPPGITFRVTASKLDDMRYIDKTEYMQQGWRQVQENKHRPLVAPIFLLNTDYDPHFRAKRMHMLEATVLS